MLLLVLIQELCINDVAYYFFLPLNYHLILSCMSPVDLLGFLDPRIDMIFLLLLFRLLLIPLLCLSLILSSLLKSVGAKLCGTYFSFFKTITLRTSSLVLLELNL